MQMEYFSSPQNVVPQVTWKDLRGYRDTWLMGGVAGRVYVYMPREKLLQSLWCLHVSVFLGKILSKNRKKEGLIIQSQSGGEIFVIF